MSLLLLKVSNIHSGRPRNEPDYQQDFCRRDLAILGSRPIRLPSRPLEQRQLHRLPCAAGGALGTRPAATSAPARGNVLPSGRSAGRRAGSGPTSARPVAANTVPFSQFPDLCRNPFLVCLRRIGTTSVERQVARNKLRVLLAQPAKEPLSC